MIRFRICCDGNGSEMRELLWGRDEVQAICVSFCSSSWSYPWCWQ